MSYSDLIEYPPICASCGVPDDGSHASHSASFTHSRTKGQGFGPTKRYVTTTTTKHSRLLICKACMDELEEEAEIVNTAAQRVPSHLGKLGLLLALVIAFVLPYLMPFTENLLPGGILGVVILFSIPIGILLAIASAKGTGAERVRAIRHSPAWFFIKWSGKENYQVPNEKYRAAFKKANPQLKVSEGALKYEINFRNYKDA
ncbi:MAG: hypothetical protein MUP60_04850, partial [Candidatus Thorarchaeota archaeon]|nr:hypothetical protein [Candidatus Thorarchaeota archaeon]